MRKKQRQIVELNLSSFAHSSDCKFCTRKKPQGTTCAGSANVK